MNKHGIEKLKHRRCLTHRELISASDFYSRDFSEEKERERASLKL